MPKRTDIESVLILGAGPIVIGQACEFDYSGTQACRALMQEGFRVILVNSNPATIMTDPETAHVTYIEPVEWRTVAKIIERERPDALLPTMGGQTSLNCAMDLMREGVIDANGIKVIGASCDAIDMAEDRSRFRDAMSEIGLESATSLLIEKPEEADAFVRKVGFPIVVRPSFTLGGSGGGIVYNREELEVIVEQGLALSPVHSVLLEESLLGWKEYEMEVVRDAKDNAIIVCSIENLDPMGVHTGDSITVAPALTLTDKEYQRMRDASLAVLRKIGVETGGSNVQFAVNPADGRMVVIEMNPRVSRSSALASKATGFPIAKVATRLAVGYTLDELENEITGGKTPASFEPSIDYIVTKIPRFAFEKMTNAEDKLGTQMQSVGEVMAIGRTFNESLQKALCGLEVGIDGFSPIKNEAMSDEQLCDYLSKAHSSRILHVGEAFRRGWSIEKLNELTRIDKWFLTQIAGIIAAENELKGKSLSDVSADELLKLKRQGFADNRLATLLQCEPSAIAERRESENIKPVYKRVDTCAAEFDTDTAYLYSCYDKECESRPTQKKKIMILGGGPNRIGQGIEFDYCCVQATQAWRELGYETVMVNCNPETVSTDYDISDRLYFEPLMHEHIASIARIEEGLGNGKKNDVSIVMQFGGQTPLKLANGLERAGFKMLGTTPDAIDLAEDRERFQGLLSKLGLLQPPNGIARSVDEAFAVAKKLDYPLVVRPSYVLGGRAMEIVHSEDDLKLYIEEAMSVTESSPLLLDRFLNNAIEVDVDAVSDGKDVFVGGIMEHIEEAGIHSGDSACCLPPYSLSAKITDEIAEQTRMLAKALNIIGLLNIQFAVVDDKIYILEANPRASRTVPFVSKAIGIPLAKVAARCMAGISLAEHNLPTPDTKGYFMVKEAVLPFVRFPNVDPLLGPEMYSTGEVMGVGASFAEAYYKAQLAASNRLPDEGLVFISVRDEDKKHIGDIAKQLLSLNFKLCATGGTANALKEQDIPCEVVYKVTEDRRPHIVDRIKNDEIKMVINTTSGQQAIADSYTIRREALQNNISYTTTIAGAKAIVAALVGQGGQDKGQGERQFGIYRLQSDIHQVEHGG